MIFIANRFYSKIKNHIYNNDIVIFGCEQFMLPEYIQKHRTSAGKLCTAARSEIVFLPHGEALIAREKSILDYEFNLYLKKSFFTDHRFQTSIGFGYSRFVSVFSRPYRKSDFVKIDFITADIKHIGQYIRHKMIVPLEIGLHLGEARKLKVGLQAIPSFSFRRKVLDKNFFKERDKMFISKKWEFKPYSLEINPYLEFRLSERLTASLSYRLMYIQKLDRTVFFPGLFSRNDPDPDFLHQKTDNYNPVKVWLSVGYSFK